MYLKFYESFIKNGTWKRNFTRQCLSQNNLGNLNFLIPLSQWVKMIIIFKIFYLLKFIKKY